MLLGFFALVIGSLLVLLFGLLSSPRFLRERRPGAVLVVCLAAAALRALFIPLSRLERVRSLSVFSPKGAGFFSIGGLTASPADIFLTSSAAVLIAGCLIALAWPRLRTKKRPAGLFVRLLAEGGGFGRNPPPS